MIYIIADNITSPLGATTQENLEAVLQGRSALRRYEGLWGIPTAVCASLFSREQTARMTREGMTRFEALALSSAREAMSRCNIEAANERTLFVLSTTKGNIELLDTDGEKRISPAEAAEHIARALGFKGETLTVCNACISGVSAMIIAGRLLEAGCYDTAVVTGADVACRFTVSGFQALKAVSEDACRPFDLERLGLNLGEAAATVVLSRKAPEGAPALWAIEAGAVNNDAHHITSPSPRAEGASAALKAVAAGDIALINAHGTATMFNDQMESVAIERAGLNSIPVNGLKGYYGHTLGAAGVLETIVSLAALRDHTILATRGFEERGVSGKINVTAINSTTDKTAFIKMISGFGGGNAAITLCRESCLSNISAKKDLQSPVHRVVLTPTTATIDGKPVPCAPSLTSLYKHFVDDYPKYYKMDGLSRLGFIASELLLQAEKVGAAPVSAQTNDSSRAIVLFNSSSSVAADKKFIETIADDNFFPSPSVFVYTLPNIVTGEIAMRNGYHGETSFYVLPQRNEELMRQIILATLQDSAVTSMITGWVDYYDENNYEADLMLMSSKA